MITPDFDEETVVTVGREIRNRRVRAMYLSQVCKDPELRIRLEEQLTTRRKWQFGMRSLFVMMLIAAILSTFLGISVNTAIQARRHAEQQRLRAMQAAEQARAAMLQLQAAQNSSEEDSP